jgi:hypothetical protein
LALGGAGPGGIYGLLLNRFLILRILVNPVFVH